MNIVCRRHIVIGGILLLGAAAHLPAAIFAEITGEDELLFGEVALSMLATMIGVPGAWRQVLRFYYPPLQALLPAPLIALFGMSAWTLRLPGAIAGVLAAVLLYVTLEGRDRRAAALAGVLAAACSVAANHHYALTCGIFSACAALATLGLVRFWDATDERVEDSGIRLGAFGIVAAMMTLPDAYFSLPILAIAYLAKRGFRFTRTAWYGAAFIVSWAAVYGIFWLLLPNTFADGGVAGGTHKSQELLSRLGAWRVRDLTHSFAAGSSWLMLATSALLIPIGWHSASKGIRWMVAFYAFPLALWTFLFDYSNVRSAHMLLAFPAFAAMWSLGAFRLYDWALARSVRLGRLVWLSMALVVVSAFYQTAVLHIADWVPENRMGPAWLVLRGYYPQGRRLQVFGQHAAGWWMRTHSTTQEGVCSNLGGAFSDYYAARPHFAVDRLSEWVANPKAAQQAGVRYYAYAVQAPGLLVPTLDAPPVALIVRHQGRETMRVYDLWREAGPTVEMDAADGRKLFRQLD